MKSSVQPKAGYALLIGRPNVGKSTLINAIIGHKVAIVTPKPQTTRFPMHAVYEDDRGQIIFIDTPGIFGKVEDELSRKINPRIENFEGQDIDVVLYVIDPTRKRDFEENVCLGIVRRLKAPKVLVINKTDIRNQEYRVQYKFIEEECDEVIEISAANHTHVEKLITSIFSYLPEREPIVDSSTLVHPAIDQDSKTYISEIIREKAYLTLRREVPYRITVVVDAIEERQNGNLYIKARILTIDDRYKGMIIGKSGITVKEIGSMARKELEISTNKRVFLDLTVETDRHWVDYI